MSSLQPCRLRQDATLGPLTAALGRNIQLWHHTLFSSGHAGPDLLFEGFDVERFNQNKRESSRLDARRLAEVQIALLQTLEQNVAEQVASQSAAELCRCGNISDVHDLRMFLRKVAQRYHCSWSDATLREYLHVVPLNCLPSPRATMLWIHRQEDRVWRSRVVGLAMRRQHLSLPSWMVPCRGLWFFAVRALTQLLLHMSLGSWLAKNMRSFVPGFTRPFAVLALHYLYTLALRAEVLCHGLHVMSCRERLIAWQKPCRDSSQSLSCGCASKAAVALSELRMHQHSGNSSNV